MFVSNLIGHGEYEGRSNAASSLALDGIANVFLMLSARELGDLDRLRSHKEFAASLLSQSAAAFGDLAAALPENPLLDDRLRNDHLSVLDDVVTRLSVAGVEAPSSLAEIPAIGSRMMSELADAVHASEFSGQHADFQAGQALIDRISIAMTASVALSRFASLSADPFLQG